MSSRATAVGLVRVRRRERLRAHHVAELASTRAALTGDHERGGAAAPAPGDVGARGLFAHRVERGLSHERLDLDECRTEAALADDPAREPPPIGQLAELVLRDVDQIEQIRRPRSDDATVAEYDIGQPSAIMGGDGGRHQLVGRCPVNTKAAFKFHPTRVLVRA
jgi:hypothetical protein